MKSAEIIDILFCRGSTFIPMGRLAYKERRIYFEYTQQFLATGLKLSPLMLPLQAGVIVCQDFVFDGLLFQNGLK